MSAPTSIQCSKALASLVAALRGWISQRAMDDPASVAAASLLHQLAGPRRLVVTMPSRTSASADFMALASAEIEKLTPEVQLFVEQGWVRGATGEAYCALSAESFQQFDTSGFSGVVTSPDSISDSAVVASVHAAASKLSTLPMEELAAIKFRNLWHSVSALAVAFPDARDELEDLLFDLLAQGL